MKKDERIALNKRRYDVYAQYRDGFGYTDYYISKRCGVPRSCISDWKTGISFMSVDNLYKVCKFLGITVEDIAKVE